MDEVKEVEEVKEVQEARLYGGEINYIGG